MKLPRLFVEEMKYELGEEFPAFIDSFRRQCCRGLRVNTLKIDVDAFLKISPFDIERIPWTEDGFYYSGSDSPGRHPYYYAGLYYIQEPSAMLPVTLLDIRPGEKVLDLCAAPGGKSVQIAARMNGQGVLVSNEIDTGRAKALVKNIELCGVTNAVVTMESPEKLEGEFPNYFDKILVDAPCSGEGMFRKDENAAKAGKDLNAAGITWFKRCCTVRSNAKPEASWHIPVHVQSEENEGVVETFYRHPEFELVNIDKHDGMVAIYRHYINDMKSVSGCGRISSGEGHFAACLEERRFGYCGRNAQRRSCKNKHIL